MLTRLKKTALALARMSLILRATFVVGLCVSLYALLFQDGKPDELLYGGAVVACVALYLMSFTSIFQHELPELDPNPSWWQRVRQLGRKIAFWINIMLFTVVSILGAGLFLKFLAMSLG